MKVYDKVVNLPISEVKPYWNNPRINEKTKAALVEAYQKIGFNQPIVVDRAGVIVKGHARFYAAKIAGFSEIPAIITDATEEQNRADRISDNKIQDMTEWDVEMMEAALRSLDLTLQAVSSLEEEMATLPAADAPTVPVDAPTEELRDEDLRVPGTEEDSGLRVTCPKCGHTVEVDAEKILGIKE